MDIIKGSRDHAGAVADLWNAKALDPNSWWYGSPTKTADGRIDINYARQDSNPQPSVPKTDARLAIGRKGRRARIAIIAPPGAAFRVEEIEPRVLRRSK